jgi:hypothetical protein
MTIKDLGQTQPLIQPTLSLAQNCALALCDAFAFD